MPEPTVISLNGDWEFAYRATFTKDQHGRPMLPGAEQYTACMPVPGYWDDHAERLRKEPKGVVGHFYYPRGLTRDTDAWPNLMGIGFYRTSLEAPADWANRSITLHVGGVRLSGWVWLNGKPIAQMPCHFLPYDVSLGKRIKPGTRNEIVIAVCNSEELRRFSYDVLPDFAYGLAAGIHGPVFMKIAGPTRIADCYLRPLEENRKLSWAVELEGDFARPETALDWAVCTRDGRNVLGRGTTPVTGAKCAWITETFGMQPWSDRQPNLYRVRVTLRDGQRVSDRVEQDFGIRTIQTAGAGLRLNGHPLMLRGTCECYYYPTTCNAPLDVDSYRRDIAKLKEIGFNHLRLHTHVPSEEYMQAADESGMFFQVESDWHWTDEEWIALLRACRKHPSVVIYCCGNEWQLDDKAVQYLRRKAKLAHAHAPDALFNPIEAPTGVEWRYAGRTEKGLELQPYTHNPLRMRQLKKFSDVYGVYTWGRLSYRSAQEGDWRELTRRYSTYGMPLLPHELGINGSYLNLELERRYGGTRYGTDLFRKVRGDLEKAGLIHKARLYYENSCAWQRLIRKHCVETARLCPYVAGYNYLGATDMHNYGSGGYNSGFLNEFHELKCGERAAEVLRYNGESLILLDVPPQRNWIAGGSCRFDVYASLYGTLPAKTGKVTWQLADRAGRRDQGGKMSVAQVRNGGVERLGTIEFTAPAVSAPTAFTLTCRFAGGEYSLENAWDFWAFPQSAPPSFEAGADESVLKRYGSRHTGLKPLRFSKAPLRVLSTLDPDALRFLGDGGRILMIAEAYKAGASSVFSQRPTKFQNSNAGRRIDNLATVIADHPLTSAIPHDGYCAWQFRSMLEGGGAVVFDDPGIPFDPLIEVASSFLDIVKQSSLFELSIGQGKLLVCTLNIDLADPAAAYLLDAMLAYAAGSDFRPRRGVTMQQASRWLEAPHALPPVQYAGPVSDP